MITVQEVVKVFRQSPKAKGLRGALRGLFAPKKTLVRAVDGVTFSVERGEIIGYVGPNGAGKSTTLKMLSGILHPTSGKILIDGLSPQDSRVAVARRIGVVFGQRTQLYWDLRLGESFELLRRIYRVSITEFEGNMKWLDATLQLKPLMDVPVRQLSLGQRMRGELAAAVLHMPPILFLDEPTIGLDANAKVAVRNFILDLNRDRKVTVILTTHDLNDVEKLCRRLIVINKGKLIEDGPLEELVCRLAPYRILLIECDNPDVEISHPAIDSVERKEGHILLRFNRTKATASELIADLSQELAIRDLSVREPTLEDVIHHVYAEE